MLKKIVIGSDHAGFVYKSELIEYLESIGFEVKDVGTYSSESADYPDFAHALSREVGSGAFERGILLCGSANGVAMSANKHLQIRAGIAWNEEVAQLIRQHNDANVLCLPSRFIEIELARRCLDVFLETQFEGGRHAIRVEKIVWC
jgi:ribose 5-phosphate isomerase B